MRSVFDVHLYFASEVFVVTVALLEFEVDEEAVVVVEAEKVVAGGLVALELLLETDRVAAILDVGRPAVHAVPVLRRHERFYVDLVLRITDLL